MPINITAVGAAGAHTLQRVNVNLDESYVYFSNRVTGPRPDPYPVRITDDSAQIYRVSSGSLTGLTSGNLFFADSNGYTIKFSNTQNGAPISITGFSNGTFTLNYPFVYSPQSTFNISTIRLSDRKAVRYLTNSTPITGLTSGSTYFVRNVITGLGGSSLYDFTSNNFTTGGATGRVGPTISQVRDEYVAAGNTWATTFLNQGTFQGYQDWTVPEDGTYEFTVRGAPGTQGAGAAGSGAIVRGRVRLFRNEIITIAVGQRGSFPLNNFNYPGSGGGTFVVRKNGNVPLFIAGGGSSSASTSTGLNGVLTGRGGTSTTSVLGGDLGSGATGQVTGGPGGGFLSAGGSSTQGAGGGGFNNNLVGGLAPNTDSGDGGFGGGGSSAGSGGTPASGGAGGYGGGAANTATSNARGGGGGSWIFPSATNVATSTGLYDGSSIFNGQTITNLNQFVSPSPTANGSVLVTLVESSVFGFTLHPTAQDAEANTNAIAIAANGNSFHSLVPITYDTVEERVHLVNPHGFFSGQGISYSLSGTAASPLVVGTVYYVNVLNNYTFAFSSTPDPNFTTLNLLTQSRPSAQESLRTAFVNVDNDSFTINNHSFLVNQPIRYSNGGGTSIAPLVDNTVYYVKDVLDSNRFTISSSAGSPRINITSPGTGTSHVFTFTVINELEDSLYVPSHGYFSGQVVRYQKSRGFRVASVSSSTTTRTINTVSNHNFAVGQRVKFDAFSIPTIPITNIAITQISSSAQVRTINTAASHNLSIGHYVTVSGFAGAAGSSTRGGQFNGTHIVTAVPTSTSFTYSAEESVSFGTENVVGSPVFTRNAQFEYVENTRVLNIRSFSSSGTTRTITTTEPHLYNTGMFVVIALSHSADPTLAFYFDGTYSITVTTTNSFTYTANYFDPSNLTLRDANITISTTIPTSVAQSTVFRDLVIATTPSANSFTYAMPTASTFTQGTVGTDSLTVSSIKSVRIANRRLLGRTFGELTTDVVHGLSVGDRFISRNISGLNQNIFNGTNRVTSVPSTTVVRYTNTPFRVNIANYRLSSGTSFVVNCSGPHTLAVGNLFYIDNTVGDNSNFLRSIVNVIQTTSAGTSRTVTTDNPHNVTATARFRLSNISGTNASFYNGDWVAASVTSTTITFTTYQDGTTAANLSQPVENTTGLLQRPQTVSTVPSFTVSARAKTNAVATLTFSASHSLLVGEVVRVSNMGGTFPEEFNGSYTITGVPTATQITYTSSVNQTRASEAVAGNVIAENQLLFTNSVSHVRNITNRQLISNQVLSMTTSFEHQLKTGSTVTTSSFTGNQASVFNGTYVVASIVSPTVFTLTRPTTANVTTFTVSNRNRNLNVCEITISGGHGNNVQPGDTITVSAMTGVDSAPFLGTRIVTAVPDTNRIQYFSLDSGTISALAVTANVTLDIVPAAAVSGPIFTLNTIPSDITAAGDVSICEVPAAGASGEMIVDSEITGLQNQRTYFVSVLNSDTVKLSSSLSLTPVVDITGVGIGSQQLINTSVDYTTNTITIPNHGFSTGELVEYNTAGGTAISPLSSGTPYYIIVVDGNNIKLASSTANAQLNSEIDITTAVTPTGRHTIKSLIRTPDGVYTVSSVPTPTSFEVVASGSVPLIVKTFNPRTSVNPSLNYIRVPNHGFLTGTQVTYSNGGATNIGGLTTGTNYFLVSLNKDHIRLSSTLENSLAGSAIQLSSFGAGISHSLTTNQISGSIIGGGTVSTTAGSPLLSGVSTRFSKLFKIGDTVQIAAPDVDNFGLFRSSDVDVATNIITVPNHGFSTGTSVLYSPSSGGPRVEVVQISSSANVRTVVTSIAHSFSTLETVTISSLSSSLGSEFTGTFVIQSVPNANSFTYNALASQNQTLTLSTENQTSGFAVRVGVAGTTVTPLFDGFYYFVRSIPNNTVSTITTRDRGATSTVGLNIITFTTSAAHNLQPRNTVTVTNMTGANPELFNGTYTVVSVPTSTTFTVYSPTSGLVASSAASGTVTPATSNSLTLFNSASDATNNTNIVDILSQGTGFAHRLSSIVPSSLVSRKITAIGSDTQLTVDRSYGVSYSSINYIAPTFIYVRPQGYAVHRPFDGGVEMSIGSEVSNSTLIRQTRKYFRYQSGKGIQISSGVNFKPSLDIVYLQRVGVSTVVMAKTRRAHGFSSGLSIKIEEAKDSQGVTSTVYNGTFSVTVVDPYTFTFVSQQAFVENKAYGYPRAHCVSWTGGAIRTGMFDDQNGMFFKFDGQQIYCVRRSSTQQIAGTLSCLNGSAEVLGTDTSFTTQLSVGSSLVLRGQTYKVTSITSDTVMSIKPEFKGSSRTPREFVPATNVSVGNSTITINNHGFIQNLPVVYNAVDGSAIGGLISNTIYYVNVVNSNVIRLKALPTSQSTIVFSSAGTGSVQTITSARTGIIGTLTIDTEVPQSQWTIDPCDGTGPTGYNLDLSKIQMTYIDYSWYGAGKIRFGFKTVSGQVQYVHEFVHNNRLFESYFRSGNLPARYELSSSSNPTYVPILFHWGTSVIMDGRFDDDKAYLFSRSTNNLNIQGTTTKVFASSLINFRTDQITLTGHGFTTGDTLTYSGLGPSGTPQVNTLNPSTEQIAGIYTLNNLTSGTTYFPYVINANTISLFPRNVDAIATPSVVSNVSKTNRSVTVTTTLAHGFSVGDLVLTILPNAPTTTQEACAGAARITAVTTVSPFTYTFTNNNGSSNVTAFATTGQALRNPINLLDPGNTVSLNYLSPNPTLTNTSGANYQPLLSLRLSPTVSDGISGNIGDRDVINRMQLKILEIGLSTNNLVDVKILLNARLNNMNFYGSASPSLIQLIEHTSNDTVSGGIQVYNFRAAGGASSVENTTVISVEELFELSNSILGGNNTFPDGPDILTIAVSRLTGNPTQASARLTWKESQA